MTYSSEVLADTPLIYWRLGEASGTTAADSSGNAHDGTYTVSTGSITLGVTGALAGDSNTAATFTASGLQDVRLAYFSALNITVFTMECWYKGTGSNQAIMGRQGTSSAPYCMLVDTTGKLRCDIKTSGTTGTAYIDSSSTTINDGAWHHLAVTRDSGGTLSFYVDGVFKSSTAASAPNLTRTDGFVVASRGGSPYLNGSADEPALYTTALSSTRIAAHYAVGTGSVTGALAATLDDSTLAATGEEVFTGTLATTLDDTALASTGGETFSGPLIVTLDDMTLAASGLSVSTVTGTLASTLDDATLSSAGVVVNPVTGTLATTLDDTQLAATGGETFTGALSTTLDDTTLSAVGVVAVPVTGTLTATLADTTLAAVGTSLTVLPTPASRTYVIRRETRTSSILAETRRTTILAEHRTLSIPAEPRTRTIPAEPRTLEVTT